MHMQVLHAIHLTGGLLAAKWVASRYYARDATNSAPRAIVRGALGVRIKTPSSEVIGPDFAKGCSKGPQQRRQSPARWLKLHHHFSHDRRSMRASQRAIVTEGAKDSNKVARKTIELPIGPLLKPVVFEMTRNTVPSASGFPKSYDNVSEANMRRLLRRLTCTSQHHRV